MISSPHLSGAVLKQLTRLKGRLPDDFSPRELVVDTPVGPRPVPPSVQTLLAVEWPAKHVLVTKNEFAWEVRLPSECETERGLVREDRAWYTVGYDEGQWYLLVDLEQAADSDDPATYRVDHEGGEPVPWAERLSQRLAGIKVKRPPAVKYGFARSCAAGDVEAVRTALAEGASVGPVNAAGVTPLHLAALTGGSPEVVALLIEAGADVNAVVTRAVVSMHSFADNDRLMGRDLARGNTPLFAALEGLGYWPNKAAPVAPQIVRLLLAAGADPNRPNRYGAVPLSWACREREERYVDVAEQLMDAGAEIEGAAESLLGEAVSGSERVVARMLAAGADPCRPSASKIYGVTGVTPLHIAVRRARESMLSLLVGAASDLDVRTEGGVTPLHFAVALRRPEGARMLLDAGADPHARLEDPEVVHGGLTATTPVEIARELGNDEVVALFDGAGR
ncbi:ankyrin repeat domain-containing protein [Phytomonospora sp. NPDC050363]|uniref:ankyrin repeat domain-containing protein n=1 Tax=Phytomonospora sp. NPDC050363 TaxID=3155642 RepID=UPI00340DCECA